MENKLDEHELLRVQLEALDYQEKHGVLLTEGDFYYRYPQSFDPSARPKPDAEDGQPQWAPFRDPGGAGPSLPTGQGSGGQGGGPIYGAQEGGETQSQWQSWLQRQRRRGWYSSTTLVYSTLFGAVVGASNFTTYWQQLQIWRSSMFFLPYLLFLFTVGLPTLQLEVRRQQHSSTAMGATLCRRKLVYILMRIRTGFAVQQNASHTTCHRPSNG